MELKEGMYIRTKKGISKIIGRVNEPTNYFYKFWKCDRYLELYDDTEYLYEEDIIKSSYNIKDLIEVGDIIDKKEVINVYRFDDGFNRIELFGGKAIMNKTKIKSVVTKEQFENMEYIVGEVNEI